MSENIYFRKVAVNEVSRFNIQSRSLSHQVSHHLDKSQLFQRIEGVLIAFNYMLN